MNKSDLKIGDVVCLNGSKAPLVVESLGQSPEAIAENPKAQLCWLDLDGRIQREVIDCALLVQWTRPEEKPDHFPEVMAILSEAMKKIGVDSSAPDGSFEVDNRGAPQQDEPAKAPQRPWTSDVPSDH
jgi:hypothetical protein